MEGSGRGRGGYSTDVYTGRFLRPQGSNPLSFYIPCTTFARKKYPFRIPSIDKWYSVTSQLQTPLYYGQFVWSQKHAKNRKFPTSTIQTPLYIVQFVWSQNMPKIINSLPLQYRHLSISDSSFGFRTCQNHTFTTSINLCKADNWFCPFGVHIKRGLTVTPFTYLVYDFVSFLNAVF